MLVPRGIQAQIFEHLEILLDRLIKGRQIISDHQRAGASQENQALELAQVDRSTAGDLDFLFRQNESETGD